VHGVGVVSRGLSVTDRGRCGLGTAFQGQVSRVPSPRAQSLQSGTGKVEEEEGELKRHGSWAVRE
jgi:hypothetical protein